MIPQDKIKSFFVAIKLSPSLIELHYRYDFKAGTT